MDRIVTTRRIVYAIVFAVLLGADLVFTHSDWVGSANLHTAMEVAATLLALFVGALALVYYYTQRKLIMLYIGTGFLGAAMLDGYHAVVTAPFFSSWFPSVPSSLIPWSWIASRLFLSLFLVLTWLAWRREQRLGESGQLNAKLVYTAVGLLTLAFFLLFAFVPLPKAYYPELWFARPQEFVPALFFLIAFLGHYHKGLWKTDHFEHWLMLSILVGFMTQAGFMSHSEHSYDIMFDLAHLLKKASYILVLVGLFVSMYFEFKRAEEKDVLEKQKLQLEGLISKAEAAAGYMSTISEDLQALYISTVDTNKQLIGRIEGVVTGSLTQTQSSRESALAVGEISRSIQHIAEVSGEVSSSSSTMAYISQEGYQTMRQAVEQISSVRGNVSIVAETIRQLEERSKEIQKVSQLIGDVAAQTNLLSLNASIEAARAGEHGRGFAVVASEVKKLADQAKSAVEQIKEQLLLVAADTEHSTQAMKLMSNEFEQGVRLVEQSGVKFDEILKAANGVNTIVQDVSAASEQISASSQEVLASVEDMSHLAQKAEENSRAASELVERSTKGIQQFSEMIQLLNSTVRDLKAAITRD